MKILYLPLKKKYYEMIERGEKPEEYREKSPYWIARLFVRKYQPNQVQPATYEKITMKDAGKVSPTERVAKSFDAVCFSYGYTKRRMLWEFRDIIAGRGRPEWGAPDYETFIIKLGKRL
ncbi:hypothetical protein [uncultured Alistipes sp.]|uniref:hypothetical protein n=1 Tax=uncultured Alistipes sp. TaxID=538949 RepID=UPI002594DC21|nr:hypothetical protein [uncultured Alistipes sp.]